MPQSRADAAARFITSAKAEYQPRNATDELFGHTGSAEILRDCGRELSGVDILIDKPFNTTEFRREIVRLLAKNAAPANPAGMEA